MSKISELKQVLNKLCKQRDEITKEIIKIDKELQKLRSNKLDLSVITPEKFMSIHWIDRYSNNVYKKLSKWFQDNYDEKGLLCCGEYEYATGQRYLKLAFNQARPFDEQLGILEFIPYLDEDHVGIREKSLSQYGSWTLKNIKSNPILCRNRYEVAKFDNLMDALKYIYKHHPAE